MASTTLLSTITTATTSTSSASGLQVYSDGTVGMLRGCSNGEVLRWATTTSKWECHRGTDAVNKVKSANENVPSGTTLQSDDQLFFSVGAGETWVYKFDLLVDNNNSGTPDWKSAILGAAGWTCYNLQYGTEADGADWVPVEGTDCDNAPTAMVNAAVTADAEAYTVVIQGRITTTSAGTVNLQWAPNTSGSLSVFAGSRVTAQKVGGVDLAEMYYTTDLSMKPGTVVSLDSTITAGVKKSTGAYDKNAFGIISTKPGLLLGDGVSNSTNASVNVALSGRVPVTVSTENGAIVPGDLLTSSSIPGVAMRATKAGQVIGQAMESYNGTSTGSIIAFIKTSYYNGTDATDFLSRDVNATTTASTTQPISKNVLSRFIDQVSFLSSLSSISEIITDRLSAALEIITPKIVTGEIATNKLTTSTGNDLKVELASGERFVIQSMIPASGDGSIATSTTEMMTFDALGNAVINNALTVGSLDIAHNVLTHGILLS
jgi:hypothetical protein